MTDTGQVYALEVVAIAGPQSGKTPGDQHALLVMVRRETADEAREATIDDLTAQSWQSPEILRMKTIDLTANGPASLSETTRQALEHARANGFAVIVFDDPVPKH